VLRSGGEIAGTVRNAGTGEPLAGIVVCLVPFPGRGSPHCTETAADGTYDFEGLASGTYEVAFSPEGEEIWGALLKEAEEETGEVLFPVDGYSTLWWSSGASASAATLIELTAPQTVDGIDGSIVKPAPWNILSQGSVIPEAIPVAPDVDIPTAFNPPPTPTNLTRVTRPAKQPKPLECKRGFVKRKVRGKERCVTRHKSVRHAKKTRSKHAD
jgi:Carboxypeptidase regulatory-like domain